MAIDPLFIPLVY